MTLLRWALLVDGSSDRALVPILRWVMLEARGDLRLFDPTLEVRDGQKTLAAEIQRVAEAWRPDLLFVHRDAERVSLEERRAEIPEVVGLAMVRVVPVRMTEAWLLISEQAIRDAASNPNGTCELSLPSVNRLDRMPNPKAELQGLILAASELGGHRRERLKRRLGHRVQLVADNIADFGVLRPLQAFAILEEDIRSALEPIP